MDGERIAQDVLGQVLKIRLVFRRDRLPGVEVEAGVFPGVKYLNSLRGQKVFLEQQVDDFSAEKFFQGLERRFGESVEVER